MRYDEEHLVTTIRLALWAVCLVLVLMFGSLIFLLVPSGSEKKSNREESATAVSASRWQAPDSALLPNSPEGDLIRYGRELIAHTAFYLGPSGSVKQISNGMNCQNCHLKAGKKFQGNNFASVASTYPKYRERSGDIESIEKRVNDCMERSLNGQALETDSHEMKAFVAYIRWVGSNVPRNETPAGTGIVNLPFMDRAADVRTGEVIYQATCARCHGGFGEGVKREGGVEWRYPPLWGENSFNTGAGLYRISRMAGFIQANMPNDSTISQRRLSTEEAWDVAAFIVSRERPQKVFVTDWPDKSQKPFDHPYGPYVDDFTEQQHKYGPFGPIAEKQKQK